MPTDAKALAAAKLKSNLKWIDAKLAGNAYLMGDQFSVADAYLFTVSNWAPYFDIDLSGLAHLVGFRARVAARPAVQAAMQAEGLTN